MIKNFTQLLFCLLLSNTIFSQITLDSIEVSATHLPTAIKETGRKVSIITAEELKTLPVSTLDELLRYLPSVNVNMRNGFGVQSDIGMRGSTFAQVLFLIDNIRFNDPLTAHFNNNIPVALSEIAQVEIIHGPASASFGADAVGGVIHIKTKTYLERNQKTAFEVSGEVAGGSHNLQSADIGMYFQKDKLIISTSIKSNIADGETLINPNFTQGIAADSLYNNFFDIKTYSGSLSYLFNKNIKFYARAGFDRRDFSAKYFYTRSNYDESQETTESQWYQTSLQFDNPKNHSELNIGYKITDDLFVFNPAFAANEHITKQLFVNLLHNYTFNNKGKIAFGGQYLNRSIVSTDRGDHQNFSAGFFGILSYYLRSDLKMTASFRGEYDAVFGFKPLPQVSLAYFKKNYVLRASAGMSIRAADFTERYISSQISGLSAGRNIGNPDLDAESAISYDIGADWTPNKEMGLSTTFFYRNSKNLIDYTLTNSNFITNQTNLLENSDYFYTTNLSNSQTLGLEISAFKLFNFGKQSNFKINANYTFLKTSNDDDLVSKYLANHPKHNLGLILQLKIRGLHISTTSNYIQRQTEAAELIDGVVKDNYLVTNAKIAFSPNQGAFSLFSKILNVGNVDYEEILGAKLPKRWYIFGIQWNIK